MTKPFKGTINIDIKDSVPDWEPYAQPVPPEDAPNVLYIVLDDVGFSAMESFGGLIETPNIKRIADRGLLYTNFHTTALCSPTRSCLLTGRNHTTNSMACITEAASGFPNASGHIPGECAMIPAVLGELGWNTYIVGKWHLCPEDEMNNASTKKDWPLGRGFERFYGFLGAETNQWYPDLTYDNHSVDQPKLPEEGYHFSVDITDKALSFIKDAKVVAPNKPFFLYYAFGAAHAPHHVPQEWADKYKGKFDMGYEAYRELVFANQKKLGIVPEHAELSPINPYTELKGPRGQELGRSSTSCGRGTRSSDDEKHLFSRMAEVYAGFLSHADDQLGRVLDYLEKTRAARQHADRARLRQRRVGRGRPERLGEREQALQRSAGHDRGGAQVRRRPRHPEDLQPLSDRLGLGVQHAVQDVEAVRELPGRHRRPDDRLLAGPDQGRGHPDAVHARGRHRADDLRTARHRAAGGRQRLHAAPARGRELRGEPARRRRQGQADAVLLDARHPRRSTTTAGRPHP